MQENILTKGLRITLGAILLVFGLNKGLNFLTLPTPPTESLAYWGGLISSQYILPTVMVIEILAGISLITKKFLPLALIVLFPVTYNILMYHLILDTAGLLIPLVIMLGHLFLIYTNKDNYSSLVKK